MNSTKRIKAVINFEKVDRPPLAPELIAVTATLAGVPVREYVQDGAVIARCQLEAAEIAGTDAVFAAADLCVEAEALGAKLHFPEDNYPHVIEPLVSSFSGLEKLDIPDPAAAGRMPQILKAISIMTALGGGRLVLGNAVGPMTLASRIMDIEKMLYMIVDHPSQFHKVIGFLTDVVIRFVESIIKAGAGGVLLFDPSASPSVLPARIFREFELGPVRRIMAAAKEANPAAVTWYSVAGPVQTNPAILKEVAADVTTVDYPAPIQIAMESSSHTVINGNIKPSVFLDGTPDGVYREARALLEETRLTERFILGSGCEVPLYSPLENILALKKAVDGHMESVAHIPSGAGENRARILFLPHLRSVDAFQGETILEAANRAGASVTTYCDLSGSCGECVVEVEKGSVSPPEKIEEVQLDIAGGGAKRLACLARIDGDLDIYIPFSSRRLPDRAAAPEKLYSLPKKRPAPEELSPAFEPVAHSQGLGSSRDAFNPLMVDGAKCEGKGAPKSWYAISLDLEGENVAAHVTDIQGEGFHCAGTFQSPLSSLGLGPHDAARGAIDDLKLMKNLRKEIALLFNSIIAWLYESNSILPERILGIMVSAGALVDSALRPAWTPMEKGEWNATTCGAAAGARLADYPDLKVVSPPSHGALDGGGSRLPASILSTLEACGARKGVLIDIGSGGGVTILKNGTYHFLATPIAQPLERPLSRISRPFFGSLIHTTRLNQDGEVAFETLNGSPPLGIMGCGLLGLASDMIRLGMMDRWGVFQPKAGPHLAGDRFLIAPKQMTAGYNSITVSSEDMANLARTASALRLALDLLLDSLDIGPENAGPLFVTGPFGALAEPARLMELGFIPASAQEPVFVKHAAGAGIYGALLSSPAREGLRRIALNIRPAGDSLGGPLASAVEGQAGFPAPAAPQTVGPDIK